MLPEHIRDYETAHEYLTGARYPDRGRPLPGNGTRLFGSYRCGQWCIDVNYRGTNVVTFWQDGQITLCHGGWRTKTTADRIETYTGGRVTGRIETTSWNAQRDVVRHGSEHWECHMPDGETLAVWETTGT